MAIIVFISMLLLGSALGQSTLSPGEWMDPFVGGRGGCPGARGMVCGKSLDAVHEFVSETMAQALLGMSVAELSVPVPGLGTLAVRPPRVTEASYARFEYAMLPPRSIRSRWFDGHILANGVWHFRPNTGQPLGGTYQATVQGTDLNTTNTFSRGPDARPQLSNPYCKANISNFRIEVQGHPQIKFIENCDLDICKQIQTYFQDAICKLFDAFIKEVVNRELQLIPNRMCINGDQYRIDYGLLLNEPMVNDTTNCIRAGMEGRYIWRSSYGVPFNPAPMDWEQQDRMYSFHLSDYTFNTLFHHAHWSGYRFAGSDLSTSSIKDLLSLNCGESETTTSTTSKPTTSAPNNRRLRGPAMVRPGNTNVVRSATTPPIKCLGSLFANVSNFGPYSASDLGDIVFKTSRPGAVYIGADKGFFDGSNGALEFYGPAGQSGNRPLLARADVKSMRGEFAPKLNKANITGSIKITSLELVQPTYLRMSSEWLTQAGSFSMPVITDAINLFLDQYAQFTVPIPLKYECAKPTMSVHDRTVQLDCDVEPVEGYEEGATCRCFRDTCVCPKQPKQGD